MNSTKRPLNVLLIHSFSLPLDDLQNLLEHGSDFRVPSFSLPLGVLSLAAYARSEHPHFQFKILDANKEMHFFFNAPDKKVMDIRAFIMSNMLNELNFEPDVVGVSVNFSTGHSSSQILADVVREMWPDAKIVFGGKRAELYLFSFLADVVSTALFVLAPQFMDKMYF